MERVSNVSVDMYRDYSSHKPHDQPEDLGAGIITRYNEKLNYVAT